MTTRFALRKQSGAGMIETLVGITIGLLVVLVIYNMLAVSEGYKRMTTGYADAQITGLISHFITGQDAANGGNGLYSAYNDLINCNIDEKTGVAYTAETSLKPIPVMITRGASWNDSDSFISRQSASPHVVWSVPMRPTDGLPSEVIAAGADIRVQSPLGFMTPAKASLPTAADPHWAVAMSNDGTGRCDLIKIVNAAPTPNMDNTGNVVLTQDAAPYRTTATYATFSQGAANTPSILLNLGRVRDTSRVRYDVVNAQLRTTDCMDLAGCGAFAPQPVAQNIVLMKVQYGIDQSPLNANSTHDATIDCWTSDSPAAPTDCPVNLPAVPPTPAITILDWNPDTLIKAGDPGFPLIARGALNRIVAVRIGLVVRSDEADSRDPALFVAPATTIDGVTGTRPATGQPNATYLFNCAANDDVACQGRVQVSAGAAPTDIMQNGFRYRVYEAVIPLRNSIFNATLPP
jgi:hypothetical protein